MRRYFVAFGMLLCIAATASAQNAVNTYVNARFGTSVDYPPGWTIVEPGPENGDGRSLTDGNSQAKFLVYGRFNVDDKSLDELQREAVEFVLAGVKPSYSRQKGRWFAISAVIGDNIIYHKELLSKDGGTIHSFHAEYPVADKARYDSAVALMANSLSAAPVN